MTLTEARRQWQACLVVARRERTQVAMDALLAAERTYCALHLPTVATEPMRPALRFRRVRNSASSYPIPAHAA